MYEGTCTLNIQVMQTWVRLSNFIDTPPKRQKTSSYFHLPTEEHKTRECYPTEPEGHDIRTLTQLQNARANDEPQPAVRSIYIYFQSHNFWLICHNHRSHGYALKSQNTHVFSWEIDLCVRHRWNEIGHRLLSGHKSLLNMFTSHIVVSQVTNLWHKYCTSHNS